MDEEEVDEDDDADEDDDEDAEKAASRVGSVFFAAAGGSLPTCGPVTAATRSRLCLKLAHICTAGLVASYLVVPPSFHASTDIHSVLPSPAAKPTLPRYLTETSMSKIQWGRNTGVSVGRGLSPSRRDRGRRGF